jgi:copper chaperone CopZ
MKVLFSYVGAALAGLAAGACCWIPALLGAGAAGSLGVSAALAPYRPYFLGLTAVFLAFGFYFAYRTPKEACADGCCADASAAKKRKIRIGMMWFIAGIAVLSAAYPYVAQIRQPQVHAAAQTRPTGKIELAVSGLDCPACAIPIQDQLRKVPGVVDANLDFDRSIVVVSVSSPRPSEETLIHAIEETGFKAKPLDEQAPTKQ